MVQILFYILFGKVKQTVERHIQFRAYFRSLGYTFYFATLYGHGHLECGLENLKSVVNFLHQNEANGILGLCNQKREIGASIFNWIDTWKKNTRETTTNIPATVR